MKNNIRQNKGITLIALVITIIVLLVLAGTVIVSLTGENGLLKRAEDAGKANEEGKIRDEILLAWNAIQIDSKVNGWNNEQKRGPFETELKREAGDDAESVTVTLDDPVFTIKYKGYQTTLNANDGTMTALAPVTDNADGINWEEIMRTATKHPDQKTTNDIGIDAKGNIINLDLWNYMVPSGYNRIDLGASVGSQSDYDIVFRPHGEDWGCFDGYTPDVDMENIVCPQYIKVAR